MVRSDIMDTASIGLLSEEDICQCPVREITESNIDSVSTGIGPTITVGIQKKSPVLCNSDGYLFIYVDSNYDICICKEENGMINTIRVLKGHSHPVLQLLYNEELYHLFSCGSDGLFFWDLNTDSDAVQIVTSDITCMCFIFEQKGIAVGTSSGSIQLFDATNQYCEMDNVSAHKSEITSINWIRNKNLLATSSRDSTIAIWNLQSFFPFNQTSPKSAQLLTILQGHQGDVTALTSTQDGEFVISGGRDHSIRVWKISTGKSVRCIEDSRSILGKHNGEITYIECIENDTMLLSASTDGKLKCFSLLSFTDDSLQSQTLHSFTSIEELFSSFGDDQTLMDVNSLTNTDTIQWDHAFPETNGIVHVCHNSSFSRFFVSSLDHAFFVYSTSLKDSAFTVAHSFVGHSSDITGVASDYQNALISVSSDHHLIMTDLSSYSTTLDIDCGFALSTLTSYGEWIVTAGASYSVLFISSAFPSRRVFFSGHVGKITTLAVNSTLGLLISGGYDSQVLLHRIPDLSQSSLPISPLCSVSYHNGIITSVDLSSSINNSFFAASGGNDYAITVYSVKDTSLHPFWEILNAHNSIVTSVLFGSGMGTGMLYSGGMDCSVKVWNVLAKELVGELRYHSSKVVSLCQSSDGRYLVSASANRVVFVYDISKNFEIVCRLETKEEPACMTFHHASLVIGMKAGGCQLWSIQLSSVCNKQDKWTIA